MYNCKVFHDYDPPIVLLDINVGTLRDLAKELDMSYQQVADLNSKKRGYKMYQRFKYSPKIEISKIDLKEIKIKL